MICFIDELTNRMVNIGFSKESALYVIGQAISNGSLDELEIKIAKIEDKGLPPEVKYE